MQRLESHGTYIEIGSLLESDFANVINEYATRKIVILADENTHEHCVPFLITSFDALSSAEILVLPAGEENKAIDIVENVWQALTEYGISRFDLIINVGGGVITDMGGFIASCYKRGCKFINVSTSLIGMIDASIGGKTGINLGEYKNQIGTFSFPIATYIDPGFLATLPEEEWMSGFAEMIKHGLIAEKELYYDVIQIIEEEVLLSEDLIVRSISVKNQIVQKDPYEDGLRKKLNFGHTIGHALEGFINIQDQITHGHAIAIGMLLESFISFKKGLLSQDDYDVVESDLLAIYPYPELDDKDINNIISLIYNDKKNKEGKILCVLLEAIGKCSIDHDLKEDDVIEAFMHFKNKQINLN